MNLPLHHDEVQGAAALPLPHNIEAEQSLLGAILINNEALQRVIAFLQPEHFFEPIHKQVYDVARTLIGAGKVANPVTLKSSCQPTSLACRSGSTLPASRRRRSAFRSSAAQGIVNTCDDEIEVRAKLHQARLGLAAENPDRAGSPRLPSLRTAPMRRCGDALQES